MVRYLSSVAIVVAVVVISVGCGGGDDGGGGDGGTYKLGAILSLSGAAADLGQHSRDGIEVAVDEINAAGGVNGRELTVEFRDDATDPNKAVAALNELANDEDVLAVIGGTLGTATLAMSPVSERNGMPLLATNTTYEITRQGNPYIFRTAPPAQAEIAATEQLADQLGLKRLVLLHSTDAYADQAAKLFEKSDLELAAVESFDPEATNLTAQLTKLRAEDPDALLIWDLSPATGIAIRNAGELGMDDIPILSGQGSNNPGNIEAAGNSPALRNWLVQGVVDAGNPLARQREGVERISAAVDYPIDVFAAGPYDAIKMITEAAEASGDDPSRDQVRDALEGMSYSGVTGEYQYSADNHDGVGADAIVWLQVRNGKFVAADVP